MNLITVTIRLTGYFQQITATEEIDVELARGSTVADLRGELIGKYPEWKATLCRVRFSINGQLVSTADVLSHGDVVTLMLIMSGG